MNYFVKTVTKFTAGWLKQLSLSIGILTMYRGVIKILIIKTCFLYRRMWRRRVMIHYMTIRWLGSRVVSVLDSGAEGPGFKSQPRPCRVTVLGKLFTPIVPLLPSSEIGSSPLKGCDGNCKPDPERNGSLPPGLWLMSPAGWLPRTGISSGTIRSAIEYGPYMTQ